MSESLGVKKWAITHSHCTEPEQGQRLGTDGFLYYAMYYTDYTGI